jgi:uncharacterized protein (DUF362 family)
VSVKKTTPETVLTDYDKLLDLAEVQNMLAKGKTTILKDNISWHFYYPGANSTPWQLEGTISGLVSRGYSDLVSVHNNTVVTNPQKGDHLNKMGLVYAKHNIPVRYNCDPKDLNWIHYEPKSEMRVLPRIYPKGIKIPEFFMDKNIIHFPTMKTHIYTTTTGAMKNAFGGLLNTRRHYTHTWIHETLVDLLSIQKEIHPGLFAVMDGTIAGSGPGPRTMDPVETNLMLASGDQVAIDAVAAKIMGFNPLDIPYISMAHDAGLGTGNIDEIEIRGDKIDDLKYSFTVGDNLASRMGDLLWFGPLKRFQKLFFHTPLVYIFVFGSFLYHDYIWYPFIGKPRINKFLASSEWGRLFEQWQ